MKSGHVFAIAAMALLPVAVQGQPFTGTPPAQATYAAATSTQAPVLVPNAREARTYVLFFDLGRSDLNARARRIIAEAVGAAQRLAVTRIDVAGHADLTGQPPYNHGLSLRRAQVVGAELVRRGIRKEVISVSAQGDTHPLIQTAPGLREPQNRRVEITLK